MLPVSAWPPGPPGASLSPFGKPRQINVGCHCNGFVIPTGAWVVATGSNCVLMFTPPVIPSNPARSPGTGQVGRAVPPQPPCGCPPSPPTWQRYNDVVEEYRAWQRKTGNAGPPVWPQPGRRPPNWFGWKFVNAPSATLVRPGSAGLVIADGQNVIIAGSGFATITQAYSV
jgi:hypothetical protein